MVLIIRLIISVRAEELNEAVDGFYGVWTIRIPLILSIADRTFGGDPLGTSRHVYYD